MNIQAVEPPNREIIEAPNRQEPLRENPLERLITLVREAQDTIFQRMQENSDLQENASLSRARDSLGTFEQLSSSFVSMKKFDFAVKLCTTPIRTGYDRLPERERGEEVCENIQSGLLGGFLGGAYSFSVFATGAAILFPAMSLPAFGIAVATGTGAGVGLGAGISSNAHDRYDYRRSAADFPFSRQTVENLLQRDIGNRANSRAIGTFFTAVKIETWLNNRGELKSMVYFPEHTTLCGAWRWQAAVVSSESVPESDCAFRMGTVWNRCEENDSGNWLPLQGNMASWITANSKIALAEVQQLTQANHIPAQPARYRAAVDLLIRSYLEWAATVIEGTAAPENNRFSDIAERAVMIPATSSDLIPLAFPRTLLEAAEEPICEARLRMQACGVGTLVPSYSLNRESYTLDLNFSFQDNRGSPLVPYSSITIAKFDEMTVKAFSNPTFRAAGDVNPPNLNEMLLQAMYTGMFSPLGMPGDQTASLGEGRWVAAAERPYPGFFELWGRNPRSMMDYDCRQLTEETSRRLTEEGCWIGLLLGDHEFSTRADEVNENAAAYEAERQGWDSNYRRLRDSLPQMDEEELLTHLHEDLGIIPPAALPAIDARIRDNQIPESFSQEGLRRFVDFALPAQEMEPEEVEQHHVVEPEEVIEAKPNSSACQIS